MDELLYCCKLTDESGSFDIAAEFLNAIGLDFSSYESKETGAVFHTVYALDPGQGKANLELLSEQIKLWNQYGCSISSIEYFEMKKEDWAEVWKKYFNIIHISPRLVVKPSWLEFEPTPNQVVIEIDPGMSFGTGQHATTEYCLKAIDQLADNLAINSFMDAGCGSGILTIAATKLGYKPIYSFDYDADCIRVSQENYELNKLGANIKLFQADAADYKTPQPLDLVCANILGHLLKQFKINIASWVRPGGYLALAGILNEEFDSVVHEFTTLGFVEIERFSKKEWTSGLFHKANEDQNVNGA